MSDLINEIEQGSIWFNGFSRAERNMWNETGTFRTEFSWKIWNGPRFKMRWNLFRFVPFFKLVWNVSAIPGETERNWQPWLRKQATQQELDSWHSFSYFFYIYNLRGVQTSLHASQLILGSTEHPASPVSM